MIGIYIFLAILTFMICFLIFEVGRIYECSVAIRELDEKIDNIDKEIKKIEKEIARLEAEGGEG